MGPHLAFVLPVTASIHLGFVLEQHLTLNYQFQMKKRLSYQRLDHPVHSLYIIILLLALLLIYAIDPLAADH